MRNTHNGIDYLIQPHVRPEVGFTVWIVDPDNTQDEMYIGDSKTVYPTQEAAVEAVKALIDRLSGEVP